MHPTTATLRATQPTQSATGRAPQGLARLAGALYLVITVAAIVAHIYVPAQLNLGADPATTDALLRVAVGSELVVLLSEVVLSLVLYILFAPVSRMLALTAAVFRLIMTTIHGVNLLNYFFVLLLIGASGPTGLSPEQRDALSRFFLDAHSYGFTIGIVFLVPHVFVLGYLIYRSDYFPRVLGILFLLAACGYLFDSLALLFFPGYTSTPAAVALPIAVAEIAFPVWLLTRGVRTDRWGERTAAASYSNPREA
ncbi:DUF4386 domain-containing protein [Candidatus Chloroploca sp. Khr17]|uniref:DUF4386 domain-containing protein n=1 Tax=Candidatus Chloroploca sp. Khr17 TaxID=2496869 RepID=UPI0013EE1ABC|nr:DUF4386 domain-containing protein [Candidatus Chloroploca sp. Khr17]